MAFRPQRQILWADNLCVRQIARTAWRDEFLRGNRVPLGDQESVGCDTQRGMMVEAPPSSPFEMSQPNFLLEFLIVALDPPSQLGDIDELTELDIFRQASRTNILSALYRHRAIRSAAIPPAGCLDDPVISMRNTNAHTGKARGQLLCRSLPAR